MRIYALTAALVLLTGCGEAHDEKMQRTCGSISDAFYASTDFVKRQIHTPSTASFPGSSMESDVATSRIDECTTRIAAPFDAQNVYGAYIRYHYEAVVRYNREDQSWSLLEIDIR